MILEPPRHSISAFGLNGPVYYNNIPLHQFMFAVKFNVNPVSGISINEDDTTVIIKNVQVGGAQIETESVNEYNRSRLVHNKIKFQDTVITMHDIANGKSLRLWEKYYEYYFADGRDIIGFGYDTLLIPDNNRRYVFDSIDIYQFQAGKAFRTRLVRPKITAFDPKGLNYEEGAALKEVSFTITPEYIKYKRDLSIPGSILKQMKLGGSPEQLAGTVNDYISTAVPKDAAKLSSELLAEMQAETANAISKRAINNISGTAYTATAVDSLATGSASSKASRSSLDAFGRVVEDLQRKVPTPVTPRKGNNIFSIPVKKVSSPDGENPYNSTNNDGNFQGGDN